MSDEDKAAVCFAIAVIVFMLALVSYHIDSLNKI